MFFYFLFGIFCYDGHHLSYCFVNKYRNDNGSQKLLSLPNLLVSVMKMTNNVLLKEIVMMIIHYHLMAEIANVVGYLSAGTASLQ